MLSQTIANAMPATANASSTNARQVGLGVMVSATTTNFNTEGSVQKTGNDLDLCITGAANAFFVVKEGANQYYTRDGSFGLDADQNLVMRSNGYMVQGFPSGDGVTAPTTGAVDSLKLSMAPEESPGGGTRSGFEVNDRGEFYARYTDGDRYLIGQIATAEFSNPQGLIGFGENLYEVSLNSGDARLGSIREKGGMIVTGALEMSNINLANEMTDLIIDQRGFQANSRSITTSDEMLQTLRDLKR